MEWSDVSEAVAMSLDENRKHHEGSGSVRDYEPRIVCVDGRSAVARAPFKRKGHWCVRWAGTARLTKARRTENGVIVFEVSWS